MPSDDGRNKILVLTADNGLAGYFSRRSDSKGCPFDTPPRVDPRWGQWGTMATDKQLILDKFAWIFGLTNDLHFEITNDARRALMSENDPSLAVCRKCLTIPTAKCRYYNDLIPWVFAFRQERGDKPITEWRLTFTSWRRRCDKYLMNKGGQK